MSSGRVFARLIFDMCADLALLERKSVTSWLLEVGEPDQFLNADFEATSLFGRLLLSRAEGPHTLKPNS